MGKRYRLSGVFPRSFRAIPAVLAACLLLVPLVVGLQSAAAPVEASASQIFPTMNDGGGIFWRSGANWNDAEAIPGNGFYPGTYVTVYCYQSGSAVPGSADTMWVQAAWSSGPGRGHGWMDEHFVNDGAPIDQAAPGIPACSNSSPAPRPAPAGGQNLTNLGNRAWCLDANSNHYTSNGDPIQLWACNSHPEQEWVLTAQGQLQSAGTNYCLDANSNYWPHDGDNLQLWQCNTHREQLWAFTAQGQLQNRGTNMCLDANSNHFPSNGDRIQLWGCNTHPEQLWGLGAAARPSQAAAIVHAAEAVQAAGYHYCFDGGNINGPTVGTTDRYTDGSYSNCAQIHAVGFDCTGLTLYAVYQGTGNARLSHNLYQATTGGGQVISSISALLPGDIVYFDYNPAHGLSRIDHSGVYVGGGRVLSAVSEHWGIRTEPISWYEAGGLHFVGAKRYWSN